MTPDRAILALVVLPVVALVALGFLVRALVDSDTSAGGSYWPLWVVVLAASCGTWIYYFSETP
jgi:hypothetical protein